MITVILGTSPYPFHRAISWLSNLLHDGSVRESVFVQSGVTDTDNIDGHPLISTQPIVSPGHLTEMVNQSSVIISHAGQGSTRMLAAQGARFILLPRLARYQEHVDDHQLLFAMATQQFGISYCLTFAELKQAILFPPNPIVTKQLFCGPRLVDHLCQKYPKKSGRKKLVSLG